MESNDIKRFGLLLAVQAEIEGMKAANQNRKNLHQGIAYSNKDFQQKSDELQNIIDCSVEQFQRESS